MTFSTVSTSDRAGQIGMAEPEPTEDGRRWAEAVDKMAMALSEAGYPTTVEAVSLFQPGRENDLVFCGRFPPKDVVLRAAQLCGVRDLVEKAEVDAEGWEKR